jgi:hypothetical protein
MNTTSGVLWTWSCSRMCGNKTECTIGTSIQRDRTFGELVGLLPKHMFSLLQCKEKVTAM